MEGRPCAVTMVGRYSTVAMWYSTVARLVVGRLVDLIVLVTLIMYRLVALIMYRLARKKRLR